MRIIAERSSACQTDMSLGGGSDGGSPREQAPGPFQAGLIKIWDEKQGLIQGYSKQALGFIISWHSLRTTYVSRCVELEQSPSVVMANTGDSPRTILKYYAKLPEVDAGIC